MSTSTVSLRKQLLADAGLLLVTAIWGATFVMVKEAVEAFPVFAFLAIRFSMALLFLAPFAVVRARRKGWRWNAKELGAGVLIGLALFAGYAFQTFGLQFTMPAKAGFITGLSVVMVPALSALLLRRPPDKGAVIGVFLATAGLVLLSWQGDTSVMIGDVLVLLGAVSFALHIIALGAFAPTMDNLTLVTVQIATVALLSAGASFVVDRPWPVPARQVLGAAVFTGVAATALAFGIQTIAQRFTTPTHTALIFSMEPVWAGLFSFLLIGEQLGPRVLAGGALILAGMLVAELLPAWWEGRRQDSNPGHMRSNI